MTAATQRQADITALTELRDQLPAKHAERPGIIRAIEVLRFEPLVEDEPNPHAAERLRLAGPRPTEGTCGVPLGGTGVGRFCDMPLGHEPGKVTRHSDAIQRGVPL